MAHTPMEILIDWVDMELKLEGYEHKEIMAKSTSLLEQEKQMVIDAYNQGYRDGEQADSSDIKKDVQYFDDANNYFINKYKK